jgi:uncharacterized repeat protein (TIGR03843 family)
VLLRRGELTLRGLLPWSSNYTFLGDVSQGDETAPVVYKPVRGEQPLWDFPRGTLARRETAAYLISAALGWDLAPPTVLRGGPHGPGSVQLFVDCDQSAHFFTFHRDPIYRPALQALALFDIIVNNADRKGGHCLAAGPSAPAGHIVAIDQGLCFHVDPKLRTVIWDFAGEAIPARLRGDLRRLADSLAVVDCPLVTQLAALLAAGEIAALRRRLADLLAADRFPEPPDDRRPYPWPLV